MAVNRKDAKGRNGFASLIGLTTKFSKKGTKYHKGLATLMGVNLNEAKGRNGFASLKEYKPQ